MIVNGENVEIRVISIRAEQNEVNWLNEEICGDFVTLVELGAQIVNEDKEESDDAFIYFWQLNDHDKFYVTNKSKYEELLHGIPSDIFVTGFNDSSLPEEQLSLTPIDKDPDVIEIYNSYEDTKKSLFRNCFEFLNVVMDTLWTMYGGVDFYPEDSNYKTENE